MVICESVQPPAAGALLRAAFVASCFWGTLPPVDLQTVCFVLAMLSSDDTIPLGEHLMPTGSVSIEKLCQAEIE